MRYDWLREILFFFAQPLLAFYHLRFRTNYLRMKRAWLSITKEYVYALRVPCGHSSKSIVTCFDPIGSQQLNRIIYA